MALDPSIKNVIPTPATEIVIWYIYLVFCITISTQGGDDIPDIF